MNAVNKLFLQALDAALRSESVQWGIEEIQPQQWQELFQLAHAHHVLAMVFEAVYSCPAAQAANPGLMAMTRQRVMRDVMMQTMRTADFCGLYQLLRSKGITPCVVKGIVCRSLYPNPDDRMSNDEDMLIPPEQFPQCYQSMTEYGMQLEDPEQDVEAAYEVPFRKPNSPLYIELHKHLFPPESEAYGEFNRYFEGIHERLIEISVDGVSIATMGHTDHLFYLITHAFKHFLHSGFGIRQVCDIVMYANAYGEQIQWERVVEQTQSIRADGFTRAIFRIGEHYLHFDPDRANYPTIWRNDSTDETALLEDLLASGVYGASDMSRKHSSNITLNAVAADKQGKKASSGVMQSAFPSVKKLENQYPYLKKHPYLLPVAWTERLLKYSKETAAGEKDNNAAESIRIGTERIELMRKYGVIK